MPHYEFQSQFQRQFERLRNGKTWKLILNFYDIVLGFLGFGLSFAAQTIIKIK
jgi:hypothetical protein